MYKSTRLLNYHGLRKQIKAGDVIAFGGKGHFSEIIKMATRSPVSHVGVVLQTAALCETGDRYFNMLIESTKLGNFSGVMINRLSDRLRAYDGEVWWLPVGLAKSRETQFFDFLFAQDGKPYDMPSALKAGLDALDFGGNGPTAAAEDYSRLFCSELVAGAFKACGLVSDDINPAEVTPIDLCCWPIYQGPYVRLAGGATVEIPGYGYIGRNPWLWE